MPDDALNPMANDAGWPHIATDLRAENAKLCGEIERLRTALRNLVDAAEGNISDNEGVLFQAQKVLSSPHYGR